MNRIDVCFSPALIPQFEHRESVVVVTDVFRATTTISTAFANGCSDITPVATEAEALAYKEKGWLTGAEHLTERCAFADFGNSPAEYSEAKVGGKSLVMKTTNGTVAIKGTADCHRLLVGAFVNVGAVARRCRELGRDVLIVCSGSEGRICLEDSLFAGALAAQLVEGGGFAASSDSARMAVALWNQAKSDLSGFLKPSEHARRLTDHGFGADVDYCLQMSVLDIVPELEGDKLIVRKE